MKKGIPAFRILFLGVIMLVGLGGIAAKLWWVQVARGAEYTARIQGKSQVSVRLPAVRGEIMDRNGIPLAQNKASFEVDFYLPDIVRAYRAEHGSLPLREDSYYHKDRRGNLVEKKEPDIPLIVNETIIPRLADLGLEENYNAERLQVRYRNEPLIPYTYRQNLDFDTMARFLEHNVGLPGLKAEVKPVRSYPYGALAAHLLGYVGAPRNVDAEEAKKFNFYQPDVVGLTQIEKTMDHHLRGEAGSRILQRDAKGQILEEEVELVEPKQGANVYLTIDARLQYIVEDVMRNVGRGAAVVIDPNNGDILAMASVPSFDPNVFIPSIKPDDWVAMNKDETVPMLNRSINAYVPGSTYKIVTALAVERAGLANRNFTCTGGTSYGSYFQRCWIHGKGSHGSLGIEAGIKHSCNSYFAQAANAAGIKQIEELGHLIGLGQLTGIPLSGEQPGILDGPTRLLEINPNDRWRPSLTANVAIGQGAVLATPLQMALLTATVANGGTCYYPRIIDRVVSQDGKIVEQEPAKVRANLITDAGMTAEQIEQVRHGMWRVVNENGGTARKARLAGIEVSGKTGTAQNRRVNSDGRAVDDNNVLFIAFAPYEKPKYAVCVLVQGGKSGGGVAAPLAAKILEEAFALETGEMSVQLARLDPAPGNFKFVESIDFDREIPSAVSASDGETVDTVAPGTSRVSDVTVAAVPSIREEPDAEGRVKRKAGNERKGLMNFFNFGGGNKPAQGSGNSANPQKRTPFRR